MTEVFTKEELALIRLVQETQLANPTRAVVNSESAFVYNRLLTLNVNLATRYWNHVCRRSKFNDVAVDNNERALKCIDNGTEMPSWGTHGT